FLPLDASQSTAAHSASIGLFLGEIIIGLFSGLLVRTAVLALETAGAAMSMFSGLHLSSFFTPFSSQGDSVYGTFLSMTALTMLFLGDMHHWILRGIVDSYAIYSPGQSDFPVLGMAAFADWVSRCFAMSLQLSAPLLVTQLLFFLGIGLVNRLVMQIQVYFLAQPAQILMGVLTFCLSLPLLLRTFFPFLEESIVTKFIANVTE
ncbi:MAG: flagellar biosynthetic protein FliR, partial [Holosporales bacterium]|nr:flagellar biosynthetic protein FliR [Holosporales bacterium]